MSERRFYWLKLKEDFFDDKHIRYLRKLPDGDRLTIVYLRMQLLSLKTEGIIQYSQLMPSCSDELALALDEETEIVKFALAALQQIGLVEVWDDQTVYMSAMQELVGVEGSSAERVRRHREKKALHCNGEALQNVTQPLLCHGEKIERKEQEKRAKEDGEATPDASASPPCPYSEIISLFNSICVSYPRITRLSDARKKAIKARLNQYSVDDFKRLFELTEASAFLKGSNNRNWSATFDWIIKDGNIAKILDGNYRDRQTTEQPFVYGGEHGGDKDGLSL